MSPPTPHEIVEQARSWVGTPFRHRASCRGAGADCLGLLRGVWRALYGAEPWHVPAYQNDWTISGGATDLREALRNFFVESSIKTDACGKILMFRMRWNGPPQHLGISALADTGPGFVHAYQPHGVVESALTDAWRRRVIATFSFPDRSE